MNIHAKRHWIFCAVVGLMCLILAYTPTAFPERTPENTARLKVRILSVDNRNLAPLGIVYSGAQEAEIEIMSGTHKGMRLHGVNYQNSAIDKDKLFEVNDTALAVVTLQDGLPKYATLIDHYRLDTEAILLTVFAVLLIAFGGISGAAVGTILTCILTLVFGNMLKLNGGSLPYIVPLLAQSSLQLNVRDIFFAMVFIANSGAIMDLSMDISSACEEIILKKPEISKTELIFSGFSIGRSVIGTMTTTLMLAYAGSYLSMMMYFAGQGTPLIDILNLKYVASEILLTLVGSFGLVTVAPFTALVAGVIMCDHAVAERL